MITTSGVATVSYCFGICAMEDKPTDTGALGTEKCVLFVLVTELAYVLGSNPRFCGFDSRLGHHAVLGSLIG